jgi:uncharacterized membrane protein
MVDESPSMTLYGNDTMSLAEGIRMGIASQMENLTEASEKVSIDVLSGGERTQLGDELYRKLTTVEGNGIIVLLSDGNSNYGKDPIDVARQLGRANTTIHAVALQPEANDIYVAAIDGDAKVTSPSDYQAEVTIATTSLNPVRYRLSAYVDGREITSMQSTQNTSARKIPLKFSLNDAGVHYVTAEIAVTEDNIIRVNDRFIKTVEVVEKPRILLVTNKTDSLLKNVLDKLYDVKLSDRLPNDMAGYDIIYLDDVNANSISRTAAERLREYVLNGNGLAVVGGKNSFDYGNYNNSYFETLLPVLSMEKPVERRKQIAVVVLIDISASTEYGVSEDYRLTPKIDFEKALAIKILRGLDVNDSVGVIAFNTVPYTIAPLEKLGERRAGIESNILRLTFGGGTDMLTTMDSARDILKYYAANKYVIVLSDGVIRTSRMPETVEKAGELSSGGIKVYTVGVGFDTDENFMQQLAEAGKGSYFKPEAYQRLNIEFGRGVEEEIPGLHAVEVRDEYHFITRNLNITANIKDYNKVREKSIAQLLLATKSGSPILTVWNFGLGRVAALTTDDGLLWGASIYQEGNNRVISSMTNWAIGGLEKNKKVSIKTGDVRLGDAASVRVSSKARPNLLVEGAGSLKYNPDVKAVGLSEYSASLTLNQTGFYGITARSAEGTDADGIAVNYAREYTELEPNLEALNTIARAGGGRLYRRDEVNRLKSDIIEQMKKLSTRTVTEEKQLYQYLVALALAIYFLDAVVRRIREIMRPR